ncbi:helix-turn-helix domain-containing protein [Puia sp. P3]|uniref:helix-turn-helix domain-containing protein n=1 Tax=Puia sp. P3 TaxID=3423952 RepID=UPI003D667813
MKFALNLNDALPFSTEIPTELRSHFIPGSMVQAASNGYGKLLLQELPSAAGPIYYHAYHINRKTVFRMQDEGPFFSACIALQHESRLEVERHGAVLLREGQYNIIYSPVFDFTSSHEGGREYISIRLQYSLPILEEWAPYFPILQCFLEKVRAGRFAMLSEDNSFLTREIQDMIYRLIHHSRERAFNPLYFDLLARTLLFHLLRQSAQQQPRSPYSNQEINGIHEAREMICKNIRYHYKIGEIAQKVGMNEFKLKNGFRQTYGDGLYEYLVSERMLAARNLLADPNRNIKEIAALTGYKTVNSFIKVFKRRFNKTPGEFRQAATEQ